jgi:hypothetical protein
MPQEVVTILSGRKKNLFQWVLTLGRESVELRVSDEAAASQ